MKQKRNITANIIGNNQMSLLSSIDISRHNFHEIANTILNKILIVAGTKLYRVCETEFYLFGKKHHDYYTHRSVEQSMKCKFYFHKYHNGTYKSGTYKGIDITIGCDNPKTFFGCLIRSIYDIKTHEFVEGPCNCVNKILSNFNCSNVNDFMHSVNDNTKIPLDIYDTSNKIYIIDSNDKLLNKEQLYCGNRIGLSDKYPKYQNKSYRFAIMIQNIKKQRKSLQKIS